MQFCLSYSTTTICKQFIIHNISQTSDIRVFSINKSNAHEVSGFANNIALKIKSGKFYICSISGDVDRDFVLYNSTQEITVTTLSKTE